MMLERASKIKGETRGDGGEKWKKNTDCEVDVHVSTYTTFKQRLNYHYYYY